jgi:hypothetical protein
VAEGRVRGGEGCRRFSRYYFWHCEASPREGSDKYESVLLPYAEAKQSTTIKLPQQFLTHNQRSLPVQMGVVNRIV